MDKTEIALKQAKNFFNTADHLVYVSYPLLKDNKLFIVAINNLYMSALRCMDAVFYTERLYKRIEMLPYDIDSRMAIFESEIAPRLKLDPKIFKTIRDLKFIVQQHKDGPVEFSRMEKFVICNHDYSVVKAVDMGIVKSYILNMRHFLHFVEEFLDNVRRSH